jgi:hypothetical protein
MAMVMMMMLREEEEEDASLVASSFAMAVSSYASAALSSPFCVSNRLFVCHCDFVLPRVTMLASAKGWEGR